MSAITLSVTLDARAVKAWTRVRCAFPHGLVWLSHALGAVRRWATRSATAVPPLYLRELGYRHVLHHREVERYEQTKAMLPFKPFL